MRGTRGVFNKDTQVFANDQGTLFYFALLSPCGNDACTFNMHTLILAL